MNEPTTDEKIQQLVRAVLDAVDSRLDGVRHELAVFAGDVERRHHQVLDVIADMEARVDRLERSEHEHAVAATAARNVADSVDDVLEHLQSRLDRLETDAHAAMSAASAAVTHSADLAEISKPLYSGGHVTSQLPIVTDPAIHQITSLAIPPAVPPTMTSPTASPMSPTSPTSSPVRPSEVVAGDITDEIDLEQLTNLLNERLGHLELPTRPETRHEVPPVE